MIATDWLAPYACLAVGKILLREQIADRTLHYCHCNGRAGFDRQRNKFLPFRQRKNDVNGQATRIV